MVTSWLQSFFSPSKPRFVNEFLRKCGFSFCDFLNASRAGGKVVKDLLQEEERKVRTKSLQDLVEVEKIIGYSFSNRSLLHQAFTHPSYSGCASYERLEYVGDSVLNLLITAQQFALYPDLPPGCLTPLRAANVDTEKLARVAVKHKFHKYLRHRKPVLEKRVLADIVESTVGAVFIDSNSSIDTTWEVTRVLLDPIITPEVLQTNPVKRLFELCQKHKLDVQLVDIWTKEGTYEVFVNNQLRGKGICHAKKEVALNRAAYDAYNEVVRTLDVK